MTVPKLLAELGRQGIQIAADGDSLRYSPKSAVTPAILDKLKANKAELLATLRWTDADWICWLIIELVKRVAEDPSIPWPAANRNEPAEVVIQFVQPAELEKKNER